MISVGIFHTASLGSDLLCVGFITTFPDGDKEATSTRFTFFQLSRPQAAPGSTIIKLAHGTFRPGHISSPDLPLGFRPPTDCSSSFFPSGWDARPPILTLIPPSLLISALLYFLVGEKEIIIVIIKSVPQGCCED